MCAHKNINMSVFTSTLFIKYDDVAAKSRREFIEDVRMGDFGQPVLEFSSGDRFSLDPINTRILVQFYGKDSRDWLDMAVELYAGVTVYQGQKIPTVLIKPLQASDLGL